MPLLAGAQALSTLRQGALSRRAAIQDDALETAEVAANGYVTAWVLTQRRPHRDGRAATTTAPARAAERAVALVAGLEGRIATMARARLALTRAGERGARADRRAAAELGGRRTPRR